MVDRQDRGSALALSLAPQELGFLMTDEAEPTVEEVWERSIDIFRNELACWPPIGPGRLIRLAARDHYIDPPGIPELCRIDYLATVAPIMAYLYSSTDGLSDHCQWPPCTPAQFAATMESHLRKDFAKYVEVSRMRPGDLPNPDSLVH